MFKKIALLVAVCSYSLTFGAAAPINASKIQDVINKTLIDLAERGRLSQVKEMLDKGADINYRRSSDGATALVIVISNSVTALVSAVLKNYEDIAQELLNRGANPNIPMYMYLNNPERFLHPQRGIYPIYLAVMHNNLDLIKQLLSHGAYIDVETEQEFKLNNIPGPHTPLDIACDFNHFKAIKILIDKGASLKNNQLALAYCCSGGSNLLSMAYLLKHGANPNVMNKGGLPLISSVILNSNVLACWTLLKYDLNVNQQKEHSNQGLRCALKTASPMLINQLYVMDPHYGYDQEGYTPLHFAILGVLPQVIEPLLKKEGVNPNARGIFNITPLHLAMTLNHNLPKLFNQFNKYYEKRSLHEMLEQQSKIIDLLVDHGADPSAEAFDASKIFLGLHKGMNYLTPLLLALQNGDIDLFQKMLSHCSRFNECNISHINYALKFSQNLSPEIKLVDILKKLHGKGSSLGMCTDGQYSLHLAVQAGDTASVDWLVRSGKHYNQENCDGITPIELARSQKACSDGILNIFAHIAAERITRELRTKSTEIVTTDGITELYDNSIGNLERLSEFLAYFEDISGADENIRLIQKFGKKENLDRYAGRGRGRARGNAQGALFELEAAYSLVLEGKQIKRLRAKYDTTEFDIETTSGELVECKSVYWPRHIFADDEVLKKQLLREQRVAKEHDKKFIFYSKNAIPEPWKEWMENNNIVFKEDIAAPSRAETERYAFAANHSQDRIPFAAVPNSAH